MAKLLLEYGADVNFKNNNEETPLHLAVRSGTFRNNKTPTLERAIATFKHVTSMQNC